MSGKVTILTLVASCSLFVTMLNKAFYFYHVIFTGVYVYCFIILSGFKNTVYRTENLNTMAILFRKI